MSSSLVCINNTFSGSFPTVQVSTSLVGTAHLAWGADLGLAGISTVAVLLYTLTDRQAVGSPGGAWEWQYKGLYQNGTESEWLQEEEVRDSFTPLQLDVFHALWETYKGQDGRPRPESESSKGKRDTELHAKGATGLPGWYPSGAAVRGR